jgi:hypothetical protein
MDVNAERPDDMDGGRKKRRRQPADVPKEPDKPIDYPRKGDQLLLPFMAEEEESRP